MRKLLLAAIAIISIFQISCTTSQDFSLLEVTSDGIYSTKVGGVPQDGILKRMTLTLPEYKKAVMFAGLRPDYDNINQTLPFCTTDLSSIFSSGKIDPLPDNNVVLLLLELTDGSYMAIQPMSALDVTTCLVIKEKNVIEVVCGSLGTAEVAESNAPLFAYAKGDDMYGILYSMWDKILKNDQVAGRTTWRSNKEYSEIYKYLGWCSWEQYRKDINEPLLIGAVNKIEKSDVPIRWVLVDDGHQNDEKAMLIDFTLNKEKFPNGWAPVLAKRSEKVKWFGLWHCMYAHWGGVSRDHKMDELRYYTMESQMKDRFIVGEDPRGSKILYEKLVNSVAEPGFDFTKIDVQTSDFVNYIGANNAVIAHRQNAENLEAQTNEKLSGLMNCMAQNLPCVFNTRYSATTRVSIDYKLNDLLKARSHIYQSFHNTIWMGQTVWPDHDMFHSSDEKLGRLMAVSKAMSAAPVYLSDAPEDFIDGFIMPLCYSDGELLRPLAPGTPLSSSIFADAFMGGDTYSVIAPMTSKSAAIVAYNVSDATTKTVTITEKDYTEADAMVQPYPGKRQSPKEGLVYYDWYNKCGGKLQGEYSFDLANAEDRIVLLSEIENGWSVIGREDKYLSTVAVKSTKATDKQIDIELCEAGPIVVYSKAAIKAAGSESIKPIGSDLYVVNAKTSKVSLTR